MYTHIDSKGAPRVARTSSSLYLRLCLARLFLRVSCKGLYIARQCARTREVGIYSGVAWHCMAWHGMAQRAPRANGGGRLHTYMDGHVKGGRAAAGSRD